jgi:benzoyl-CoA reductase/2-hydroxyglutaryl-CoA dehydratase subunit BcrC/BadD/HgdB
VPVAERLRGAGVKTLVLELEASEVAGQERTRLQAFLESL